MFPIPWNKAYRKKDGSLVNIDDVMSGGGGGGGGGSFTPDYENDRLIIGVHGDYNYFIPMEKEYIGQGIQGYEIKRNSTSSQSSAKIDVYSIIYGNGEVVSSELITTLTHNGTYTYDDDNISITYNTGGANWVVTSKVPLYDESGDVYTSPLTWTYSDDVDYVMLLESPV